MQIYKSQIHAILSFSELFLLWIQDNHRENDRERDQFYNQLEVGDTIPVEVYRSRNGEYKIADEESPINFLLCCAAILVGLVITAAMVYGLICPEKEQTNSKGKKRGKGKQNQTR